MIKAIVPHDINATESFVHVIGDFVSIGVMGCLISYDDVIEIFCVILDMVKIRGPTGLDSRFLNDRQKNLNASFNPCFPIVSSLVSHEYTKESLLTVWGGFPLFF